MPEISTIPIQLKHMGMEHAVFQRLGGLEEAEGAPPQMKFGLGAKLLPSGELIIEMTVEVSHQDVLEASVTYLGVFFRGEAEEPELAGKVEEDWRFFAARVAPTVLYPYVRETLTTLALKAGLSALVVPIVNFSGVFDPADMEFEVVDDAAEKKEQVPDPPPV